MEEKVRLSESEIAVADHSIHPVASETAVFVVERAVDRTFLARTADGATLTMRQAVSCLVTPTPGDRVLAAKAAGEIFILAILERSGGETLRIETDGELNFVARRISFKTGMLDILADTVTMMGEAFNSLFRHAKRVVGSETVIAKSTTLRAGERVSIVAHADVQQAGVLSQSVDGPLAINSHTAIVTAKADIRLNGERINVG